MKTEYQTAGGGGVLKKLYGNLSSAFCSSLWPLTPQAHLMLRRSHPRMAVSLAVASWVLLWWGLHLPEVNFSCPLPSKVALLEIWRGKSIHKHFNQWLHIHQGALAGLYPVQDGLRYCAPVNTPQRLKLLILMRVKETGLLLQDRKHTFHLFFENSMTGAAVSLQCPFLECSIGESQWKNTESVAWNTIWVINYHVSLRDTAWRLINIHTII